jgi:hypothetical protein
MFPLKSPFSLRPLWKYGCFYFISTYSVLNRPITLKLDILLHHLEIWLGFYKGASQKIGVRTPCLRGRGCGTIKCPQDKPRLLST